VSHPDAALGGHAKVPEQLVNQLGHKSAVKRQGDYHDFLLGDMKRSRDSIDSDEYYNFLTGDKKSHEMAGESGPDRGGYWHFVNGEEDGWKKRNYKLTKNHRTKRLARSISFKHPSNRNHLTRRSSDVQAISQFESIASNNKLSGNDKRQMDWDEFVVGKKSMEDWDDFVVGK